MQIIRVACELPQRPLGVVSHPFCHLDGPGRSAFPNNQFVRDGTIYTNKKMPNDYNLKLSSKILT